MSRGQQGIGIGAAGMYGQLTTGAATRILSGQGSAKTARPIAINVQIDTTAKQADDPERYEQDWKPDISAVDERASRTASRGGYKHGTCVSIEMEAAYQRGKQSVDEFVKQCAIVNPHLTLHYQLDD